MAERRATVSAGLEGRGAPRPAGGRTGLFLACCLVLVCAAVQAAAQTGGNAAPLRLTIEESIFLALKSSRAAIEARLGREEQGLALEAAEERYLPRAGSIDASANTRRSEDWTASVSLGPSLRVPTGGAFSLRWSKPLAGQGDRSGTIGLTFRQPLLKGFGTEIDTWPLHRARK